MTAVTLQIRCVSIMYIKVPFKFAYVSFVRSHSRSFRSVPWIYFPAKPCHWSPKNCICAANSVSLFNLVQVHRLGHFSEFFRTIHHWSPKNCGHSDWPGRNLAIRPGMKKINLEKVRRNEAKTWNAKLGNREIAAEWKLVVWASRAWWRYGLATISSSLKIVCLFCRM